MSNYNGRRGPNVSQYLRELSTQEAAPAQEESVNLDEDLTMFTNTSFFDIETGMNTDFQSQAGKPDSETLRSEDPTSASTTTMDELSGIDFMTGEFNFTDFGAPYTTPTLHDFQDSVGSHLQPIQPHPQSIYPMPPQHQHHQQSGYGQPPARVVRNGNSASHATPASSPSSAASTVVAAASSTISTSRPMMSFEEGSRLAAEEDKRRRNTAASARFRIKKKQREQALEKNAKEMNAKLLALENQITKLEMENKWLKGLVMEKNNSKDEDLVKLFKDYSAEKKAGAAGEAPEPKKRESPEEHEASEMTG